MGLKCSRKRFEMSLAFIHELLVLAIAAALFTVCLIISINLKDDTSKSNSIEADWNLNSMTDITVSNKPCVAPYTDLFDRTWQGTYPGCNCLSINSIKVKEERRNKINRGIC